MSNPSGTDWSGIAQVITAIGVFLTVLQSFRNGKQIKDQGQKIDLQGTTLGEVKKQTDGLTKQLVGQAEVAGVETGRRLEHADSIVRKAEDIIKTDALNQQVGREVKAAQNVAAAEVSEVKDTVKAEATAVKITVKEESLAVKDTVKEAARSAGNPKPSVDADERAAKEVGG